jgi:hypothetical protein
MAWLPDAGTLTFGDVMGFLRDLLSVGLAALGSWLAWLAIRMGRENEAVTGKQTALAESMNGLLGRVAELEAKQATMLERQHEVFERELSKRAVLKLLVPIAPMARADGPTTYELFIINDGDKPEAGYWFVGVPKRLRGRVEFETKPGNQQVLLAADKRDIIGEFDQPRVACFTDDYYLVKFKTTLPVEPGVMMPCGSIAVQWLSEQSEWCGQRSVEIRNQAWRVLLWFTNGASGRYPEGGMKKLRLYGAGESWFKNYHGGIELPLDDADDVN